MDSRLDEFATFVNAALRMMTRLNKAEIFTGQGITPVAWLSLRTISEAGTCSPRILVNRLGMTRQRVGQILDTLKAKDLVLVTPAEGEGRQITIALSPSGEAMLAHLDTALGAELEEALGAKAEAGLSRASKLTGRLTQTFTKADGAASS
ncbi:MAG: MarR family transcriptional regulator [Pseudomonadota bacterium]